MSTFLILLPYQILELEQVFHESTLLELQQDKKNRPTHYLAREGQEPLSLQQGKELQWDYPTKEELQQAGQSGLSAAEIGHRFHSFFSRVPTLFSTLNIKVAINPTMSFPLLQLSKIRLFLPSLKALFIAIACLRWCTTT
jgi:hypothetical protein